MHTRYNKNAFFIYLVPLSLFMPIGFWGFRKYQNIDITGFIEPLIFFSILFLFRFERINIFAFLAFFYLLFFSTFSIIEGVPIFELVVSLKSFILYIFLSNIFISRNLSTSCGVENVMRSLITLSISAMFIKYSLSHLLQLNSRPLFFDENNFEVVLPIFVIFSGLFSRQLRLLSVIVVLMSLSKSGIGTLIILSCLTVLLRSKNLIFINLLIFAIVISIALSAYVYLEDLLWIDRFQYVYYFFVSSFDLTNTLIALNLRPLSSEVCSVFSYMETKFSFLNGTFVCYSRILHLWWLRVFYDFGVFGLILHLFLIIKSLQYFDRRLQIILFCLGALNGLSVSGFGNLYFVIVLLLAHVLVRPKGEGVVA